MMVFDRKGRGKIPRVRLASFVHQSRPASSHKTWGEGEKEGEITKERDRKREREKERERERERERKCVCV